MRNLVSAATLCGVLFSFGLAEAQTTEGQNFSVERFQLSLDREGMMNLEWAGVPDHLAWDISLWLGYADDPLVLYSQRDDSRQGELVAGRLGAGLVLAISLFEWVEIGAEIPFVLYQSRPETAPGVVGTLTPLSGFGIGGPRIVPKIRILRQKDQGVNLAFVPTFRLMALSSGNYFDDDSVRFEPELLLSRSFGLFRTGMGIGYRMRASRTVADLTVNDELFASLGLGLQFAKIDGPPLSVDVTINAASQVDSFFASSQSTYSELIGGVSYIIADMVVPFIGAGVGLSRGPGAPDWRVFGGLRFSRHSSDADGDGIVDDDDECPNKPEDKDDFEDADGCPDLDNDRDDVPDLDDGAPNDPEDKDDFEDLDGVPDPDNDQDGVLDINDACPLKPGPAENRGCPDADADGDGIMDSDDSCPDKPEDKDGFEDEDGCPDPDDDDDGVIDTKDDCPRVPGVIENRGCPDADRDGDTVVDRLDNCPDEPGDPRNQGCVKRQLVKIAADRIEILQRVYFATNRDVIRRRSYTLLENVADVLNAHPEITSVVVEGHTDDRGSRDYNVDLSRRRAEAVKRFLMEEGVLGTRLKTRGYGPDEPIESNRTRKGRAKNRRVDFRIVQ